MSFWRRTAAFSLLAVTVIPYSAGQVIKTGPPVRPKFEFKPVPVTVRYAEILHKSGKPDVVSSRTTLAIRSDGATAYHRVVFALDGKSEIWRTRQLDFANGDVVDVNDTFKIVTAFKTRSVFSRNLPLMAPQAKCEQDIFGQPTHGKLVVEENLRGERVVKFNTGSGSRPIANWRSLDLGCIDLRRFAEFTDSAGKITDSSELIATQIIRGEPAADLFAVPLEYEAVPPSEHYLRDVKRSGQSPDSRVTQQTAAEDAVYHKYRIVDLTTIGKTPRRTS
jgi:hypothetical protein